jgi:hypothetical protein
MDKYVPYTNKSQNQNSYWEQKIIDKYISLKLNTKQEAKLAYIEHVKTQDLFEAHQFYVKVLVYI